MMRILAIAGAMPFRTDGEQGVTAAHVVTNALVRGLRAQGHAVSLQLLAHPSRTSSVLSAAEEREASALREADIDVLEPLFCSTLLAPPPRMHLRSMRLALNGEAALRHFSPGISLRPLLDERIARVQPNVILSIWCPEGIAATHGASVPRVAYHGDIDPVVHRCRTNDRDLFATSQRSFADAIDQSLRLQLLERSHLKLMRAVDVIANVTACNAEYYSTRGHPRSIYVGNVWPDPGADRALSSPPPGFGKRPALIIGHLGYLNRTGGTYGLRFLLRDVLPKLEKAMAGRAYEMRIIGGGNVVPALRPLLDHPRIKCLGFVPDLDAALHESDVVCLLNNAGPYKAAYTRHVVSWAHGLCLVAHADSAKAIPEILSDDAALLGSTPDDVAACIAQATQNADLNARVRRGGRRTFLEHFTPEIVALRVESALQQAVKR